jgi:hypothetical protein
MGMEWMLATPVSRGSGCQQHRTGRGAGPTDDQTDLGRWASQAAGAVQADLPQTRSVTDAERNDSS